MDRKTGTTVQQTLIDVYDALNLKLSSLTEVTEMTNVLKRKLERTEDDPREGEKDIAKDPKHLDIVQMFSGIVDKLGYEINSIHSNTNHSISMIG